LGEHEHELLEMNTNSDKLQQTYNELLEFKLVLTKVVSRLFSNIELSIHVLPTEDRRSDSNDSPSDFSYGQMKHTRKIRYS